MVYCPPQGRGCCIALKAFDCEAKLLVKNYLSVLNFLRVGQVSWPSLKQECVSRNKCAGLICCELTNLFRLDDFNVVDYPFDSDVIYFLRFAFLLKLHAEDRSHAIDLMKRLNFFEYFFQFLLRINSKPENVSARLGQCIDYQSSSELGITDSSP